MKKSVFIMCALLSVGLAGLAQEMRLPLWAAGAVPNYNKTDEKEIIDTGNNISIRLVQQPDVAVYLPAKRNATGQAIVVCPGGGYGVLAYDWEGTNVAKWLNSKGIAAIVLKYRLPNSKSNITPNLTPLLDAQRAIRLVRAHATRWNIKADKVGIMGFSAGGHLASTAGTRFNKGNPQAKDSIDRFSARPDFMVLVYPVITMQKPLTHGGSRNNLLGANPTDDIVNLYSNELQVTSETPPTFLLHATDDGAVPVENSLAFYQALKNNKVPVEMHIYPYGGHGFGLAVGRGYLETWTDRCIDWLRSINK